MGNLIHLKTTGNFQINFDKEKSEKIIDAFVNACSNLDAGLFEPFMNEDDCFEDLEKYEFLNSLKLNLDRIKKKVGNEIDLIIHDSVCTGCSYGKPIKCFYFFKNINGERKYIDGLGYVIEKEADVLKDIYQCNGIIFYHWEYNKLQNKFSRMEKENIDNMDVGF
jgi:hypothetical protein